jgi:chromosome segregation ATPase
MVLSVVAKVEELIAKLRHEDATLNREQWQDAVNHFEAALKDLAGRVESLEARVSALENAGRAGLEPEAKSGS